MCTSTSWFNIRKVCILFTDRIYGHVGSSEETSIISLSSNNWEVFVKEVLKLQMMELVTMQISPSLCYFIPFRSGCSHQHLFWHHQSVVLPQCEREISLQWITEWKIIISSILIFMFLRDRVCDLVVRVPSYKSREPGSIPGAARFSEK
jgi:hypothetical protein